MFDITRLGKVYLARGSHDENANGALCVNEAAILAAGFEHRAVKSADDCPPCFSRVSAQYAIVLNDGMPDDLRRQLLTPFIMRLAGTADSNSVELKRLQFIVLEHVRRVHSYVCRTIFRDADAAAVCEGVHLLRQTSRVTRPIAKKYRWSWLGDQPAASAARAAPMNEVYHDQIAYDARNLVSNVSVADTKTASSVYRNFCVYAHTAARIAGSIVERKVFTMATNILDEAIKIGNHSEPLTIADLAAYPEVRGASPAAPASSAGFDVAMRGPALPRARGAAS